MKASDAGPDGTALNDGQLPFDAQARALDAGRKRASGPSDASAAKDASRKDSAVPMLDASSPMDSGRLDAAAHHDASLPMDSGAAHDACLAEGCRCTVDAQACDKQGHLLTCDNPFTGYATKTCNPGWVCVADPRGRCAPPTCTPNAPVCDGDRATTCDARGYVPADGGTDCKALHQRCALDGTCKPTICNPGDTRCDGEAVERCDDTGTAWQPWLNCDPQTQACADDSDAGAECVAGCEANAPICDGDRLTVCLSNGSGPAAGGTSCSATGDVCDPISAACKPRICTPSTTYCKDGNVYRCISDGAVEQLFNTCSGLSSCIQYASTAYCEVHPCEADAGVYSTYFTCAGSIASHCRPASAGPDPVPVDCSTIEAICDPTHGCSVCDANYYHLANNRCEADVCVQGQLSCVGNRVTTCNADGSAFDPGGMDCATSGMICDQSRQCAQQAIDRIGTGVGCNANDDTATYATNLTMLYHVDSDRHLTGITLNVGPPVSGNLIWSIYESSDAINFTQVWTKTISIADSASALMIDSGPLSVPLRAGNQYTIGVYSTGYRLYGCPFSPQQDHSVSFGEYLYPVDVIPASMMEQGLSLGTAGFQQLTTTP